MTIYGHLSLYNLYIFVWIQHFWDPQNHLKPSYIQYRLIKRFQSTSFVISFFFCFFFFCFFFCFCFFFLLLLLFCFPSLVCIIRTVFFSIFWHRDKIQMHNRLDLFFQNSNNSDRFVVHSFGRVSLRGLTISHYKSSYLWGPYFYITLYRIPMCVFDIAMIPKITPWGYKKMYVTLMWNV